MIETLLSFFSIDIIPFVGVLRQFSPIKNAIDASLFLTAGFLLLVLRFFWVRALYWLLLKLMPTRQSLLRRLIRRFKVETDIPEAVRKRQNKHFEDLQKDLKVLAAWIITATTIYCLIAAVFVLLLSRHLPLFNQLFLTAALITLVPWFRRLLPHLIDFYLSRYQLVDYTLARTITRMSSFLIVISVLIILLEYWGIAVAPIITGLGIFGIALALGAQDLFRNIIAGITILSEKRFGLFDVIELNAEIYGTVEKIGLRTTQIRRFDDHLIYTPNATLADQSLVNISRRGSFRLSWQVGVEYGTTPETLVRIRKKIKAMLDNHPDVIDNGTSEDGVDKGYVHISGFAASSIDILIYCYFETTTWARWLVLREEIALGLMEILEQEKTSFAFPSQTVYLRHDDPRP